MNSLAFSIIELAVDYPQKPNKPDLSIVLSIPVWRKTQETLMGYKAIKYSGTGEVSVCGKYGYIYEYDSEQLGIVIKNHYLANRINKELNRYPDYKFKEGEEAVFQVRNIDFKKYMKLLKVPKEHKTQVKYANRSSPQH